MKTTLKNGCLLLLLACVIHLLSCEEIIGEEDISEVQLVLTAPSDGAVLTETDITLSWEPLKGADQYHIQIATPSFEGALQVVKDSILPGNNLSVALTPNAYEWRVKAVNSAFETEFSTGAFSINK
ncbi:MAG: fibronectin type III domain-containing protein [Bacteroidota bacterium]